MILPVQLRRIDLKLLFEVFPGRSREVNGSIHDKGGEHGNHVADVPLNGLTLGLRTAFNFQTDDILEVTSVCDWNCLVVLVR